MFVPTFGLAVSGEVFGGGDDVIAIDASVLVPATL